MNWTSQRDEGGHVHLLPINDEVFVKVEKSRAGDYFLSVYREGDPCGDDVEYFPNLYQAKKYGSEIAAHGQWQDYLLN